MSREIDTSKPLSQEDRQYLLSRGNEQQVERLDALHRVQLSEEERRGLTTPSNEGPAMPDFVNPTLATAEMRAAGNGETSEDGLEEYRAAAEADNLDLRDERREETLADQQEAQGAALTSQDGDQYDSMRKPELTAEAERRGLPTGGTAEQLRARLRDADQA